MKKYVAEFLGSFFILFTGLGSLLGVNFMVSAMGLMLPYGFSAFLAAMTFAATTGLMYYIFNRTSGGHFNPAVTLAVFVEEGVKNVKDLILYIIAQMAGCTLAVAVLWFMTGQRQTLGQVGYGELSPLYMGVLPAVIAELIISIVLVLVFLTVRDRKTEGVISEGGAAAVIGISVFAAYGFGILATGGGANPARIFASAVITMGTAITQLPLFFFVPLVGGILAFLIFKSFVKMETKKQEISETAETAEETSETDENTESADIAEELSEKEESVETDKAEELSETDEDKEQQGK